MTRLPRAVLAIFAAVVGCTADSSATELQKFVNNVVVSLGATTLTVGQTVQASAVAQDATGGSMSGVALTWASSDSAVATVSSDGAVTAVATGTATISASAQGKSASVNVTVAPIPVATVSVVLSASSVVVEQSATATATTRDANGAALSGRAVTWLSSNPAVATVSASGGIATLTVGTTVITATSEGVTGNATLTVTQRPLGSATVSLSKSTLLPGETATASATLRDASNTIVTGRPITWSSSNASVASVDENGRIVAVAPGAVTITATSDGVTGTATLSVVPIVSTVSVSLGASVLTVGKTTNATATLRDANNGAITGRIVTWRSSNSAVATVSGTGVITAVGSGQATITATHDGLAPTGTSAAVANSTANGLAEVSGSATLTVQVAAASVAVSLATSSVRVGSTTQATGIVRDANNSLLARTIAWSSSNSAVATVNANGTVTGIASGTANIVGRVDDATGSAAVTITPANTGGPPLATTLATESVNGTVNAAITPVIPVTASGGTPPYAYQLSGGTLPAGLTFSQSSGQLSGTPTAAFSSTTFSVTVTDAANGQSSKNFQLTVNGASAPGPECATPRAAWIWCDDFETNRLSSYYEYNTGGGKFLRTTGAGLSGSVGMRTTYTQGVANAGSIHLAFGKTPSGFTPVGPGTANYREIYWRFYVRREAGWVGNGPDKLTRATVFAGSNYSQAMIAHGWTSDQDPQRRYLLLDPARGTDVAGNLITTTYNDFAHLTFLGAAQSAQPEEDQAHVGQWACYEFHVKLNDAGQTNGVFDFKVNGSLSAQKTGLNFLGSYNTYGINAVFIENFQNAGAPAANVRTFDNFVVSTQPIGCL